MSQRVRYVTVPEVLFTHVQLVSRYGGPPGVLNEGALKSAVARPRQTVGGEDAYKSIELKAAALFESLLRNHCFVDGNKRVAYTMLGQFLRKNGLQLQSSPDEAESLTLSAVKGECTLAVIADWITGHSKPTPQSPH